MSQIKISPEELDTISRKFANGKNQSEQLINTLNSEINALRSKWEGKSQRNFFGEFESAKKNMANFLQNLQSISDDLKHIATKFREADGN